MNIFQQVNSLYTRRDGRWIVDLEESEIQPFIIQRFLSMNDAIREYVRWLDKYVFTLPAKMYLSLAWTVIPKSEKAPFVKYIKKEEVSDEYDFILKRVQEHLKISDSDLAHERDRIISIIKDDMAGWFSFYGIEKRYWDAFRVDYKAHKLRDKNEPLWVIGDE